MANRVALETPELDDIVLDDFTEHPETRMQGPQCRIRCSINVLAGLPVRICVPINRKETTMPSKLPWTSGELSTFPTAGNPVLLILMFFTETAEFAGDVATNLPNQHLGQISTHMELLHNTKRDSKDSRYLPQDVVGSFLRLFSTQQPSVAAKIDVRLQT